MRPDRTLRLGFVPRLSALYVAIFIYSGIQMPFFPVWLKAKDVDPALIGVLMAVPSLVRMIGIPFAAREADRRDAVRLGIVVGSLLSVAAFVLVGLSAGTLMIAITYTLAAFLYGPVLPLTETYALHGLAARGRSYGPVRLWGSAAFIGGNLAAGVAADLMPARHLVWLLVAASALIALASLTLLPVSTAKRAGPAPAAGAAMLRDRGFLAVLAAAALIQASHAVFYSFSTLQWRSDGLGGGTIAALWAIGVLAEIVLFAVSGRLTLSSTALLTLGAAGAALRWLTMALDPPLIVLPFLQMLHALSFGATHLGALTYVARHAPEGQAATAQGHLAMALSGAMALATALSGLLYANFGVTAYAAMALAAVAGGICAGVARRAPVMIVVRD